MTQTFNFEEAMIRLNQIAELLENDSLPIEEAIKLFDEGLELSKLCQERLNFYEKSVTDLVAKHQGDNHD